MTDEIISLAPNKIWPLPTTYATTMNLQFFLCPLSTLRFFLIFSFHFLKFYFRFFTLHFTYLFLFSAFLFPLVFCFVFLYGVPELYAYYILYLLSMHTFGSKTNKIVTYISKLLFLNLIFFFNPSILSIVVISWKDRGTGTVEEDLIIFPGHKLNN